MCNVFDQKTKKQQWGGEWGKPNTEFVPTDAKVPWKSLAQK
jgi:hypothetical protein